MVVRWRDVKKEKPRCPRSALSMGTTVLVWPRSARADHDGVAFYGRRVTGRPEFYIYGAVLDDVTHWMPLPDGPQERP